VYYLRTQPATSTGFQKEQIKMNRFLLSATLLLALQASDCATAGSIQDSSVTRAKRETDAGDGIVGSAVFLPGNDAPGTLRQTVAGDYLVVYSSGESIPVQVVIGHDHKFSVYPKSPKLPQNGGAK
jgi:hypothetical protein